MSPITKRLLATATACAAITSLTAVATPAADADTLTCVSKPEFRKVKKGMTLAKVENIFDIHGKVVYEGSGFKDKTYKPCTDPKYGFVSIGYYRENGALRVYHKGAYWG